MRALAKMIRGTAIAAVISLGACAVYEPAPAPYGYQPAYPAYYAAPAPYYAYPAGGVYYYGGYWHGRWR